MLETYKATLRGNQLEWNGETPEFADGKSAVEVIVTILEKNNNDEPRPFGLCAGEFTVAEDFDAPLPEEILADFEN
jgi:hypothetical protein